VPAGAAATFTQTPRLITLAPATCSDLELYVHGRITVTTSAAVLVFTHETQHARLDANWRDETATECRAIAQTPRTISMLGVTKKTAVAKTMYLAGFVHRAMRAVDGYGDYVCPLVSADQG
ncbi:MAG TPA: hypothetical protein VJ986_02970, partial [Gaiellaceae bacterium]|nr:hypothetical protein [Gaiellaceae bacterium]